MLYGTAGKLTEFVVTYCKLKSVLTGRSFLVFYCFREFSDGQTGGKMPGF